MRSGNARAAPFASSGATAHSHVLAALVNSALQSAAPFVAEFPEARNHEAVMARNRGA
jgi:hypothetical protein